MHANHQSGGAANAHPAASALPRTRIQTPEEALGLGAGGNLLSSCVIATGLTAVLLAALTAGPYFADKLAGPKAAVAGPAKPDDTAPAATDPAKPDPTAGKKPTASDTTKPPAGSTDILNKLGETGTKTGTPKSNPLDKGDDLLKDLK